MHTYIHTYRPQIIPTAVGDGTRAKELLGAWPQLELLDFLVGLLILWDLWEKNWDMDTIWDNMENIWDITNKNMGQPTGDVFSESSST